FQRHFVKDLMTSVSKIKIAAGYHHLDSFGLVCGLIGLRGKLFWHGLCHGDCAYHYKRLLCFSRNTIEVKAISITRIRKTNAGPYCPRSVYSFCGILELTT